MDVARSQAAADVQQQALPGRVFPVEASPFASASLQIVVSRGEVCSLDDAKGVHCPTTVFSTSVPISTAGPVAGRTPSPLTKQASDQMQLNFIAPGVAGAGAESSSPPASASRPISTTASPTAASPSPSLDICNGPACAGRGSDYCGNASALAASTTGTPAASSRLKPCMHGAQDGDAAVALALPLTEAAVRIQPVQPNANATETLVQTELHGAGTAGHTEARHARDGGDVGSLPGMGGSGTTMQQQRAHTGKSPTVQEVAMLEQHLAAAGRRDDSGVMDGEAAQACVAAAPTAAGVNHAKAARTSKRAAEDVLGATGPQNSAAKQSRVAQPSEASRGGAVSGSGSGDADANATAVGSAVSVSVLKPTQGGRRMLKPSGSSGYRGVTRHVVTNKWEAHLWDPHAARGGGTSKSSRARGKQVYLGAYEVEEQAARAYDKAALTYFGEGAVLNFPQSDYAAELDHLLAASSSTTGREAVVAELRRTSSGFSRGASRFRGVTRHHQHAGKWEARLGRVAGNKYLYLGTFDSEEDAARAYDYAVLANKGLRAVTNFDKQQYCREQPVVVGEQQQQQQRGSGCGTDGSGAGGSAAAAGSPKVHTHHTQLVLIPQEELQLSQPWAQNLPPMPQPKPHTHTLSGQQPHQQHSSPAVGRRKRPADAVAAAAPSRPDQPQASKRRRAIAAGRRTSGHSRRRATLRNSSSSTSSSADDTDASDDESDRESSTSSSADEASLHCQGSGRNARPAAIPAAPTVSTDAPAAVHSGSSSGARRTTTWIPSRRAVRACRKVDAQPQPAAIATARTRAQVEAVAAAKGSIPAGEQHLGEGGCDVQGAQSPPPAELDIPSNECAMAVTGADAVSTLAAHAKQIDETAISKQQDLAAPAAAGTSPAGMGPGSSNSGAPAGGPQHSSHHGQQGSEPAVLPTAPQAAGHPGRGNGAISVSDKEMAGVPQPPPPQHQRAPTAQEVHRGTAQSKMEPSSVVKPLAIATPLPPRRKQQPSAALVTRQQQLLQQSPAGGGQQAASGVFQRSGPDSAAVTSRVESGAALLQHLARQGVLPSSCNGSTSSSAKELMMPAAAHTTDSTCAAGFPALGSPTSYWRQNDLALAGLQALSQSQALSPAQADAARLRVHAHQAGPAAGECLNARLQAQLGNGLHTGATTTRAPSGSWTDSQLSAAGAVSTGQTAPAAAAGPARPFMQRGHDHATPALSLSPIGTPALRPVRTKLQRASALNRQQAMGNVLSSFWPQTTATASSTVLMLPGELAAMGTGVQGTKATTTAPLGPYASGRQCSMRISEAATQRLQGATQRPQHGAGVQANQGCAGVGCCPAGLVPALPCTSPSASMSPHANNRSLLMAMMMTRSLSGEAPSSHSHTLAQRWPSQAQAPAGRASSAPGQLLLPQGQEPMQHNLMQRTPSSGIATGTCYSHQHHAAAPSSSSSFLALSQQQTGSAVQAVVHKGLLHGASSRTMGSGPPPSPPSMFPGLLPAGVMPAAFAAINASGQHSRTPGCQCESYQQQNMECAGSGDGSGGNYGNSAHSTPPTLNATAPAAVMSAANCGSCLALADDVMPPYAGPEYEYGDGDGHEGPADTDSLAKMLAGPPAYESDMLDASADITR